MVKKTEGCENPDPEPVNPDDPTNPTNPTTPTNNSTTTASSLPNTGAGSAVAGVIGAGSIATAAGYYIASRKSLR